jgi:hypothetical protein
MGVPWRVDIIKKIFIPETKRIYCKHGCLPLNRYETIEHKDMALASVCHLFYFDK